MGGVITAERIALLIDGAPTWAVIGLTAQDEGLRAAAQLEVAQHVYGGLFQPLNPNGAQMPLPW
ncbi:hypothetical protein C8J24_2895 [Sphingomonas aerolata]|uniref:Uncharacterized protein n=1 Tax=Sphingomonas aerolata TaxID=185951 RepID=A0A2T4YMQ9_9SPHN|nr:DUF6771 family protein [Sphingomonas aerolata]PTM44688.1 hypothetical protein C8J24_2895 [Sphingomonas aerolata]